MNKKTLATRERRPYNITGDEDVMLTPDEAEDMACDAMRFFADIAKDAGVYSGEYERLLIDGAFRRWSPAQRAEYADRIAPNTDEFVTEASVATPTQNMARIYLAWLLRNTAKPLSINTPTSPCCKAQWLWKQMCGMRLYTSVNGRKMYGAKCGACRRRYDLDGGADVDG